MAVILSYRVFKKQVIKTAGGECEACSCDADQIHHFFKVSLFPEYKTDPDNGMAICGFCHSELERRLRQGENWEELIPMDRYLLMKEKINGN